MEILLIFSYLNSRKNIVKSLEIRNFSLFASFGCFLGRFYRKLDCEIEVYGKTFFYFSRFMPDLHFPVSISRVRHADFYEKLSDFVLTFLTHLDFADFVVFFCEIHLPPQDVYYFLIIFYFFNKVFLIFYNFYNFKFYICFNAGDSQS